MNASGKTLMANTTACNVKYILSLLRIHPYLNDTLKQSVDLIDRRYVEITAYNKNDSKTELKNNAPWTYKTEANTSDEE
jgi:hypothetical protein